MSAILLAIATSLSVFSCASSKTTIETTTAATEFVDQTSEETEANTPRVNPSLPDNDYEGYKFTVLSRWLDHAEWIGVWNPIDIFAEDETGEPINDAVYRRNRMVEEKFNVSIVEDSREFISGNFDKAARNAIKSNEDVYDVIALNTRGLMTYVAGGYLLNLNKINYLDFTQPYWDQNAIKSTIANKLFFAQSDMLTNYKDAASAMVFNKGMIEDFNIPSPYEMVKSGTWTFDKLLDLTRGTAGDVNGDSKIDYNDRFGYIVQYDSMESLFNAGGELIATKDADDLPVMSMSGDRATSVIEKIFDIMYNDQAVNAHKLPDLGNGIYAVSQGIFMDNRAIFMWIRLAVVEELRGMDVDFGIIPLPKYEEAQKNYYSTINPSTSYCITVPVTATDTDRTGIILEALSSASQYTVARAYYDISLQGKYVRDTESSEMLDLIFASTVYDIGQLYNFGNVSVEFLYMPMTDGNRAWASKYKSIEKKITREIDTLIKKVNELPD